MTGDLIHSQADGIARVAFNRPASRNALTREMYRGLARICREMPTDGSVRALIVSGKGGRAFAAGTDMAEFSGFADPQDALHYEAEMDGVFSDIERCPVPTIAAITGACTGGGAAIATACDLRIADARLKFGFPIARTLGNCLAVPTLDRVGRIVGFARLREILLTARLIEADEALAIGLVSEVLPDAGLVTARAEALAETLKGHAPITLRNTKEALRRLRVDGPAANGSDLIIEAYMSEDFREGMAAFLGKRAPQWKGR